MDRRELVFFRLTPTSTWSIFYPTGENFVTMPRLIETKANMAGDAETFLFHDAGQCATGNFRHKVQKDHDGSSSVMWVLVLIAAGVKLPIFSKYRTGAAARIAPRVWSSRWWKENLGGSS
jgi:hypothetical protein